MQDVTWPDRQRSSEATQEQDVGLNRWGRGVEGWGGSCQEWRRHRARLVHKGP